MDVCGHPKDGCSKLCLNFRSQAESKLSGTVIRCDQRTVTSQAGRQLLRKLGSDEDEDGHGQARTG